MLPTMVRFATQAQGLGVTGNS
ncbi:UNVERIFIED_CONTAM: hypothetical protein GTU68_041730 [Idotea baltica]|nr:hypothetical protein [Idotea baltica]